MSDADVEMTLDVILFLNLYRITSYLTAFNLLKAHRDGGGCGPPPNNF